MKRIITLFVVVILFGAIGMSLKSLKSRIFGTPEEKFWNWFQANEEKIYDYENNQKFVHIYLKKALEKVHHDLTFELGPTRDDGKKEFIISANGFKDAFPAVEALYENAPELERWTVIKYRQRRAINRALKFKGKSISGEDIQFLMIEDENPGKVGILLFFPGYSEQEKEVFVGHGFLFLDFALGEYDVVTRIGYIDFLSTESEHCENAMPLTELPSEFDYYFSQMN